jgi:hypothetical protein
MHMSDFESTSVRYDATGRVMRTWDKKRETAGSADLFAHYWSGSGRPLKYEPQEMDASLMYAQAMKDNQKRFEDSMSKANKNPHPFHSQILSLKDGETKFLNNPHSLGNGDYWDRDIGPNEGALHGDVRQSLATGSIKLRSNGSFKAIRNGNAVDIDGVVDHTLKDVYDFNDGNILLSPFRKMSSEGNAKPFSIYGSKLEKLKGRLQIENGRITQRNFEWTAVDQRRSR